MLPSVIHDFGNFFFLRIMNRWVAGSEAKDVIKYCQSLNKETGSCEINYLGERYKTSSLAASAVTEYKQLIDRMTASNLSASITIKPSQFGFNVTDQQDPKTFCEQNLLEVIRYATDHGVLTWLDMESSHFTDFTLSFYKKYASKYKLGICLQANLKRTEKDLYDLIKVSSQFDVCVRLVKGIYLENDKIAITDHARIHKHFLKLIRIAFENSPSNFGIAIGSHHSDAIELGLQLQKKHKKKFFEIQVLKGVLPGYYETLRKRGLHIVEYVPYGKEAFAYSVRRSMENPQFAKSIFFSVFFDAYKKLYG